MPLSRQRKPAALITGGAKRIGQALCLALSRKGYAIALHYHGSSHEATALKDRIQSAGGDCQTFRCDLADKKQAQLLISGVLAKYPGLDLVINNASVYRPSSIKKHNLARLNEDFAVNFNAPYILSAQFASRCKQGQIINILDTHIVRNRTRHNDYLLSKKALQELTKLCAVAFAPRIRVNAIAPGLILPPAGSGKGYLNRLAKDIPLRKQGNVGHITRTVEFFIDNTYITGQVIFVDGGEHLI